MHSALIVVILIAAGLASGIINAVAGGASVFIYPLLLTLGVPPLSANVTTSAIVWPGTISSAVGYRHYIAQVPKRYFILFIPCLIGGLVGAIALRHTPSTLFVEIVPWFILTATVLLAGQPRLHRWFRTRLARRLERRHGLIIQLLSYLAVFTLSVYGGYFGGGFGIVMLAFLSLTTLPTIFHMNGMKNLCAISMNIFAIIYFAFHGLIYWQVLPLLAGGNLIGGWLGSTYSSRLPEKSIRAGVIAVGFVISAVLFIRLYV